MAFSVDACYYVNYQSIYCKSNLIIPENLIKVEYSVPIICVIADFIFAPNNDNEENLQTTSRVRLQCITCHSCALFMRSKFII